MGHEPPSQFKKPGHPLLPVGGFGFAVYLALGAMVFCIVTDPLFDPPFLATGLDAAGSTELAMTYATAFDLYFLVMAVLGLVLFRHEPARTGKALVLVLMLGPGLIVLGTFQFVYLFPFVRGLLAVSPVMAIVRLVGTLGEATDPSSVERPLALRPWLWHLVGASVLVAAFELSLGPSRLIGGLFIWAGAFFLGVLLVRQVAGIRRKSAPFEAGSGDRGWRRFRAACAVVFIILVLPLNTLVVEPRAEIANEGARMNAGNVNVYLTVVNRYARPIEGKLQVFADIGGSSHFVDEREGLEGLGTWRIDTTVTGGGSSGMTCHLRVVQQGREADAEDTVIQSECAILPIMMLVCAFSAGIRRKTGGP